MYYDILWCIVVIYIIYLYCAQYNELPILYTYYYYDISSIHILYFILLVHYNKYLLEYFTCITFPFVVCNFNAITYMYDNGYPWWFSQKCMTQHKHVHSSWGLFWLFMLILWNDQCLKWFLFHGYPPPKFTSSVNYETRSSFLIHIRNP